MRRIIFLAALSCAALPAAGQGLFDDNEARRRIEALRLQVQQIEAGQAAAAERFSKLEGSSSNRDAILELAAQLEALRGEMAKLRGQVEVLANQGDTAAARQKDLYVDIDTRLRKLEQAREQQAAAPEKPAAGAPAAPEAGESRAYQAALDQFKVGNYPLAVSAMQGFLVTYPNSSLAPNAQYWVGLAYAGQRDYKNAIAAQRQLLTVWPASEKAPDALLGIASAQESMGSKTTACATLAEVVAKYPKSNAAASAKQRIANCKK
ncbi:MAG TPA: tol-pal system protein YbgF [Burkholderiales bacterium]